MILSRIKEYIDAKGISVAAFEKSIGAANASFAKPLKVGGNIGSDKLENILKVYTDLNPVWLMTGKGEMLITPKSEKKNAYLNAYPNAYLSNENENSKNKNVDVNVDLSERKDQLNKPTIQYGVTIHKDQLHIPSELLPEDVSIAVPFYNLPVSAGALGVLESDLYSTTPDGYLDLPVFRGCEAVFPIVGVSMEPIVSSGDWIGIKSIEGLSRSWDFLQTDAIYLIITREDRMIKFIEKASDEDFIVCRSSNASPFKVYKGDILKLYRVKACVKSL